MLTFTTESGSIYELDTASNRVRRITGVYPPTERQGDDGVWKTYVIAMVYVTSFEVALFFDWTGRGNGTTTSPIVNPSADEVMSWFPTSVIDV